MNDKNRFYIIAFSILFHILIFLLWEASDFLGIFKEKMIPVEVVQEPLVFDLRPESKPKRVIETEKTENNKKPKDAKLLSDKDSIAKDNARDNNLKIGEEYSKGEYKSYEIPKPSGQIFPKNKNIRKKEKKNKDLREYLKENNIDKYIEKQNDENPQPLNQGLLNKRRLLLHDNQLSKSLERGGLSFNTYNWDFAPYMLMLKAKIQSNIFPPLAFTKLGIISGTTILRFRIYPDGRLEKLVVLNYNGHKLLVQTSYDAVRISAPFPKLPDNFPEEYLEITGKFVYIIRK